MRPASFRPGLQRGRRAVDDPHLEGVRPTAAPRRGLQAVYRPAVRGDGARDRRPYLDPPDRAMGLRRHVRCTLASASWINQVERFLGLLTSRPAAASTAPARGSKPPSGPASTPQAPTPSPSGGPRPPARSSKAKATRAARPAAGRIRSPGRPTEARMPASARAGAAAAVTAGRAARRHPSPAPAAPGARSPPGGGQLPRWPNSTLRAASSFERSTLLRSSWPSARPRSTAGRAFIVASHRLAFGNSSMSISWLS
jgi:hypothetical protein